MERIENLENKVKHLEGNSVVHDLGYEEFFHNDGESNNDGVGVKLSDGIKHKPVNAKGCVEKLSIFICH